jgi:hypothetical protein
MPPLQLASSAFIRRVVLHATFGDAEMGKKMRMRHVGLVLAAVGTIGSAHASGGDDDVLPKGLTIDLRYRNAHIDQDGFADAANANTLRITLGYLWKFAPSWSAYAEGTRVAGLFGEHYNSGANGQTHLPSEGDPPSSEISAAWLGYDDGSVQARLGRQYINLDNQRYFTSGLWRQNPQSFEGLSTAWRLDSGTTLRYLYLDDAQRSVGHDYPDPNQREWDLHANLVHVDQTLPLGTLSAYDYFVENDTQAKYSWRTAGVRWTGEHKFDSTTLSWTVEGARQSSWRNNPQHYDADYHLLEVAYGFRLFNLKLGDELLGGNGRVGFSSPYGSNHAFNGWTSQFKNVPVNGLEDRYVTAFGKFSSRFGWNVTAHNFFADRGDQRYGSEINAGLTCALRKDLSIEVDYANYRRNGFGSSTHTLWTLLEYKHGAMGGG